MKAEDMNRKDAIPYLEKMRDKTGGKKKGRALEIAIQALYTLTRPKQLGTRKNVRNIA